MPKYYEEVSGLDDKRPCGGLRSDLKTCVLESDCVKVMKMSPRECLKSRNSNVPDECYLLKQSFFECKRSVLDNRQRFRGRKGY